MLMHSKSPLWVLRTLVGLVSRIIFFNSFQVAERNKETSASVAAEESGCWYLIDSPIKLN